jgi:U4/U6 small nuclear ribonucleoprotein PRP31
VYLLSAPGVRGRWAGSHGKKLRADLVHKIEKWQEAPPAKQVKPIALPDDVKRKRRGGKR